LLRPRPLRTGRENCPSSSSSVHERPSRDATASVRRSRRGSDSRVRRCCCQHPLPSELHGRHFDACSSSIEQRPCYETRLPHWTWGQPGRYCDSAGYRDESRWRGPHQQRSLRPRRQICFAPYAGCLTVHGRPHPGEVGLLSRGVISPSAQLLSGPLQAGLRFLPRPLPAAPSARLAAGLPSREDDGLRRPAVGELPGKGWARAGFSDRVSLGLAEGYP